jgi:hypothetical protein
MVQVVFRIAGVLLLRFGRPGTKGGSGGDCMITDVAARGLRERASAEVR